MMGINNLSNIQNHLSGWIVCSLPLLPCPGLGISVQVGSEGEANAPWRFRTRAAYLFVLAEQRMLAEPAKLKTIKEEGEDCLPGVIKKNIT